MSFFPQVSTPTQGLRTTHSLEIPTTVEVSMFIHFESALNLPTGTQGRSRRLKEAFVVIQSLSHVQLLATPWTAAHQSSLPSLSPKVCSYSCPLSHWCHPAIPSSVVPFFSPQSFPASGSFPMSQFFTTRWPKCWSWSFSISPSNEYSGLISFRMDWLDLLAVQGTLKSLLQHHSSKASVLWHSAFFMVQLSHPYMTTGKTIALTRWTFVSKVMSLLFNTPSWFLTAFLPKCKHLNFMAAVTICSDLGAQENTLNS